MATESGSTNNGPRSAPQTGDGGKSARGGASATGQERSQVVAPGERGASPARQRGLSPSFGFEQSPFASLWQISREMDRLMDAFLGGGLGSGMARGASAREGAFPTAMWTPQIEVRQREDAVVINVDLPGIKQEDIQIEATDEGLAISGERSEQREEGERAYRRTERTYGSFYRLIPLPEGARTDSAKATMHGGVLEITVPLEQPQRRRIQIEGGQSRA